MQQIITVSREFGSGGRELGKRVAEILGFDYYDREIITTIAMRHGLDEHYVENVLNHGGWQAVPLVYRQSFVSPAVINSSQTNLLSEQKKVIDEIAKRGNNCVIVGRNADVLLKSERPFNIFVCADLDTRIKRCVERADSAEKLSEKEIKKNILLIDKNRARTRELFSGSKWGAKEGYNLIVNTTGWKISKLAPIIADLIKAWFADNHD